MCVCACVCAYVRACVCACVRVCVYVQCFRMWQGLLFARSLLMSHHLSKVLPSEHLKADRLRPASETSFKWHFANGANGGRRWGTVSKALLKSSISKSVTFLLSSLRDKSSTVLSSWVSQEWFARNPCWNLTRMLCQR